MTTATYIPRSRRPEPESHVNHEETMQEFIGQATLLWRISEWQYVAGNTEAGKAASESATDYQLALTERMVLSETLFLRSSSITATLEWDTRLKGQWCAVLRDSDGRTI